MKICLVTAFPPSRRGLNEYGFHIARELQRNPLLSLTILADELPTPERELPGFSVVRCWNFNRLWNPISLIREIRKLRPDVVWFNIGFASYGNKALPAAIGLAMPMMARLAGFQTHVTLHQLMDTVDLNDARVRFQRLYMLGGALLTRVLLMSNSVSVLLPAYQSILQEKYSAGSVYVRPHGILSGRPEYPDFSQRGKPVHRVLAFGKWGTYKRLEPLIEAFRIVAANMPSVRLVIAGGNHPNARGYVECVADRCRGDARIEFTGYVPEEKLPDLFRSASVTVMPYSSSAGSSGVAHLASQYGVPMVASDISDFRQLAEEEGLAIEFFKTGNVESLAASLQRILDSPGSQQEMAVQNFSVALHMTMPRVIRDYLRTFDMTERVEALRSISRLRRLPRWLPLRATAGRFLLRNWAGWRSWLPSPHILQHDPYDTVDSNGGLGVFEMARGAGNGHNTSQGWLRASNGVLVESSPSAASRADETTIEPNLESNGNGNGRQDLLPAVLAEYDNAKKDQPGKGDGGQQLQISERLQFTSRRHGTNGNGNGSGQLHNADGSKRVPRKRRTEEGGESGVEDYGFETDRDTGAA